MNKIFSFFFVFLLIIIFYFFYFFYFKIINYNEINIYISKGEKIQNISNKIIKDDIIYNKIIFEFYLIFYNKFIENIKYGEYNIIKESNLFNIVKTISKPSNVYHKFTIIDGWQKYQLEDLFLEKFNKIIEIPYSSIIANTYNYQIHNSAEDMHNQMKIYKNNFFKNMKNNLLLKKFTELEIIIIASLVEKEGIDYNDKKLISSVIFNRLNKNMKLQIDATTIFAITKGKFQLNRPLTYEDLKIKDSFNTYYIKGLPKKPICYVSGKTIEIVLENYNSDYLFYFYDKKLKKHVFSKNFNEHKKKLKIYRSNQ